MTNPFFGPQGAAHIFGPQKGGNEMQVEALDKGMKHLAGLIRMGTRKKRHRHQTGADCSFHIQSVHHHSI